MRRYLFATVVLVMLGTSYALGGRDAAGAPAGQGSVAPAGKAYRFEKLAEGVYFATGTGVMNFFKHSFKFLFHADAFLIYIIKQVWKIWASLAWNMP